MLLLASLRLIYSKSMQVVFITVTKKTCIVGGEHTIEKPTVICKSDVTQAQMFTDEVMF